MSLKWEMYSIMSNFSIKSTFFSAPNFFLVIGYFSNLLEADKTVWWSKEVGV